MPTEQEKPAPARDIVELLRGHDQIVVAAHATPDGDAIGCTAAAGWLLRAMGKEFVLYNASGVPEYLNWMELPGRVCRKVADLPFRPGLVLALDCGDVWRLGSDLAASFAAWPSINIDHHLGNPCFASLFNWVDPGMAATGQMIAPLADCAGIPLRGGLAEGIYISLVSDTGSFAFGNTTAAVFALAARLVAGGLGAAAIRDKLDNQWSQTKMRLWGVLMQNIRLERDGLAAVCEVTAKELADAKASKEDLEGFVEQMRKLRGVRVALLAREEHPGRCKLSLRSCGDDDVRQVAALFGGGGHKNAAGASVDMGMDKAVRKALAELRL